eukprot:269348_1
MISYNITSCTTPNLCTMQCNPGWFIVSDDVKLLNSSEVRCITDEVPLFKLPIFTWDKKCRGCNHLFGSSLVKCESPHLSSFPSSVFSYPIDTQCSVKCDLTFGSSLPAIPNQREIISDQRTTCSWDATNGFHWVEPYECLEACDIPDLIACDDPSTLHTYYENSSTSIGHPIALEGDTCQVTCPDGYYAHNPTT